MKRLLIANGVVFLATMVAPGFFSEWFAFVPRRILTQPWGAVTYMFVHGNGWHLFLNMLILFFFGPPLESRWGSREFVKYYFICGLGGVALSFLFASYPIIGASAAIYGLMLAFAMNWPNAPILIWGVFPVKAKWLVGFLFAMSLMNAVSGAGGGVAHFAHLGGILAGFLYLRSDWRPGQAKKGGRGGGRVRRMVVVSKEDPRKKSGRGPKASPTAETGQPGRQPGQQPGQQPGRQPNPRQEDPEGWPPSDGPLLDQVDRILDKISAEGMGSLTEGERKILDDVSRRHRSN